MPASPPGPVLDDGDLHASVDGRIAPERAAALARRLAADPEARARVDGWKRQNESLKRAFAGVVLEPVPVRLLPKTLARATAREGATARLPSPPVRMGPGYRPPAIDLAGVAVAAFLIGAATAATFAVGVGGRFGFTARAGPTLATTVGHGIAARASEAHQTFATDLNRPVEIAASDEPHLLKWIQHRLAMPIRIPDLRPQGWNLIGGRIVPGELGPAAFLVYGNGIERLGLYVARTDASAGDGVSFADAATGPGSTASWVDEPFGYALTTSRNVSWLERNGLPITASVRAQVRDNASAF